MDPGDRQISLPKKSKRADFLRPNRERLIVKEKHFIMNFNKLAFLTHSSNYSSRLGFRSKYDASPDIECSLSENADHYLPSISNEKRLFI